MRAIFLCEKSENIFRVYTSDTIQNLKQHLELESIVYTKDDVMQKPSDFADVAILFSTWGMPCFTEQEIKTVFPSLTCVFYGAGSVQAFARPFLACGVKVISAWAANAVPVAEMTVAQIILANKSYFLTNRLYHTEGRSSAKEAFMHCNGNYDEVVGIIGVGMIGRLVIKMLKQYRLRVIVFDPFLSEDQAAELGVEKCGLAELFSRAFVVSNHLANNAQTQGMLTYSLFQVMRKNAVFINTGRGAQVIEEDLVKILRERPDITALLDVTYPEPPIPDHPFYTLPNCLLTPHIAGSAGNEVRRMGALMCEECISYLISKILRYEVTTEMLATMA